VTATSLAGPRPYARDPVWDRRQPRHLGHRGARIKSEFDAGHVAETARRSWSAEPAIPSGGTTHLHHRL